MQKRMLVTVVESPQDIVQPILRHEVRRFTERIVDSLRPALLLKRGQDRFLIGRWSLKSLDDLLTEVERAAACVPMGPGQHCVAVQLCPASFSVSV